MSYGGGVLSMIQRLRDNRKMIRGSKRFERKGIFDGARDVGKQGQPLVYKQATEEQLNGLKSQYKERAGRMRLKRVLLIASCLSVVSLLALGVARYTEHFNPDIFHKQLPEHLANTKDYSDYIAEGKAYLYQQDYDNAIRSYKRAVALQPTSDFARQELCRAYLMHCTYNDRFCDQALVAANDLIERYGERVSFLELRANYFLITNDSVHAQHDFDRIDALVAKAL